MVILNISHSPMPAAQHVLSSSTCCAWHYGSDAIAPPIAPAVIAWVSKEQSFPVQVSSDCTSILVILAGFRWQTTLPASTIISTRRRPEGAVTGRNQTASDLLCGI